MKPFSIVRSVIIVALLLASCSAPVQWDIPTVKMTSTPIPAGERAGTLASAPRSTPTSAPDQPISMIGVALHQSGSASTRPEVEAGAMITIVLDFRPSIVTVARDADGKVLYTSWQPWENHTVKEMRVCFSIQSPCQPEGSWEPYVNSSTFDLPVDWLGPQDVHAAVQFRDAQEKTIPAGDTSTAQPVELYQAVLSIISRANPSVAVETLSPAVQTAQAATQTAFPVTGSVLLQDGRCCAGGKAGSNIELTASFQAESLAGTVTEMRVQSGGVCLRDEKELDVPWEPFASTKTFTTRLATNWVGYYVNIQYRDSKGNLSPVYCDDISLEGNP